MRWVTEPDRAALAARLARDASEVLRTAIDLRGRAGLAVPGGTTPGPFLTALGDERLDWEKVGVTLTDERWVPPSSDRSNQRLLGETLFKGAAAAAEFVPLYGATAEIGDGLSAVAIALRQVALPLDACVLGMGEDGHTASLFPGADKLEAALRPDGTEPVMAVRAPGAEEPRITLTLPVLAAAGWLAVLIHGAEKRRILEEAPASAPIRRVLDAARDPIIYHAD